MKKGIIYAGIGLAIAIGGSFTYFSSDSDKVEAVSIQEVHQVKQDELDKAAKDIGKIKKNDDLYYAMITLTFQKLEFKGEKSYHIPGTADVKRIQFNRANLQYLKNRAVAINATKVYKKTLDKWLKGDFSTIKKDYLTIRNIKSDPSHPNEGPTVNVRTTKEEQKYIKHFFGNKGLQINKRDWQ